MNHPPQQVSMPMSAPIRLIDVAPLRDLVLDLWQCRGRLRHVEKMNDTTQAWLKVYHQLHLDRLHGRAVVTERTIRRQPYLKFDTPALKKAYPAAYERCRVLMAQHSIKHVSAPAPVGNYGAVLPAPPKIVTSIEQIAARGTKAVSLDAAYQEKLRLRPVVGELRKHETALKAALELACEPYLLQYGWTGEPWTFGDGYVYGCRVRKFSADVATSLLRPEVVARFSTTVPAREVIVVSALDENNQMFDDDPFGGFEGT